MEAQLLSYVRLFVTPWTVVLEAPLYGIFQVMEWVAISFPRRSSQPRDRTQGSNPRLLGLLNWQADVFTTAPLGKSLGQSINTIFKRLLLLDFLLD